MSPNVIFSHISVKAGDERLQQCPVIFYFWSVLVFLVLLLLNVLTMEQDGIHACRLEVLSHMLLVCYFCLPIFNLNHHSFCNNSDYILGKLIKLCVILIDK